MDVVVVDGPEPLGHRAAALVLRELRADRELVLGVATGSTPATTYRALVRARHEGVDYSEVRCVALDEYVGIPASDPRAYHAVVRREIADPLGVRPENVLVPDGNAADLVQAADAFEAAVRRLGGVRIQLLGIGRNGHLGFNEPGSAFGSRTRLAELSATTRVDNARFFDRPEDVPEHCLTQGLGTIMDASKIVLLASGRHKSDAVAAAVQGPVVEACPASVLQRHPDVTLILDREAAGSLTASTATGGPTGPAQRGGAGPVQISDRSR